ncbi:MAG: hypothetical protein P8181_12175 [bacterium]
MRIDWSRVRGEFRESPKRFFRFCGTGAAAILAVFLVFSVSPAMYTRVSPKVST